MVPTLTGMEGRRGNGSRRLNEDDEDDGPSRGSIEGRGQGRLLCERGGQLCEEEEEGGERAAKKGEESRRGGLVEKKGKRKKDVQGGVIYPTRTAPGSVLGRENWARCCAQKRRSKDTLLVMTTTVCTGRVHSLWLASCVSYLYWTNQCDSSELF